MTDQKPIVFLCEHPARTREITIDGLTAGNFPRRFDVPTMLVGDAVEVPEPAPTDAGDEGTSGGKSVGSSPTTAAATVGVLAGIEALGLSGSSVLAFIVYVLLLVVGFALVVLGVARLTGSHALPIPLPIPA